MDSRDIPPQGHADVLARKVRRHLLPLLFVLYVVAYLDRINVGFAASDMNRELVKAIADNDPVVLRTADRLRALRDAIDESVLLSKIGRLQATYLLSLEPSHPLRFLARVGEKVRSLHATSAGKALLGGLSPEELEAELKSATLRAFTPRSIVSKPALRRDLAAGRERGWYLNDEESLAGVPTISSRFKWALASYVVTIAGPSSRMKRSSRMRARC